MRDDKRENIEGLVVLAFFPSSLPLYKNSFQINLYNKTEIMVAFERDILPSHVKPIHYDVTIVPDLEKFTFTGKVAIDLQVNSNTKEIQLNANELVLLTANVVNLANAKTL